MSIEKDDMMVVGTSILMASVMVLMMRILMDLMMVSLINQTMVI